MLKKLVILTSSIALVACSATDLAKNANNIRTANRVAHVAGGVAASTQNTTQEAPETATLTDATPISGDALDVPLKRTSGKDTTLTAKPRIAVIGYNIGAITQSRAVASTRGGFNRSSASTSMTMKLAGIDDALLQSIADEAYADLVAQFAASGIEVASVDEIKGATNISKILPGTAFYDGDLKRGNGDGKTRVTGPKALGISAYNGLGKNVFNSNVIAKPSNAMDAVLIFPNLSLGFAQTSGSGNSMFARKVSVEGGAMFNVDTASKAEVVFSRDGRFADGWATYSVKNVVGVDTPFAEVTQTAATNNGLAVGLSAAMGFGMGSRKSNEYTVVADPERYKALALKAAKGYNAALVQQVVSARSGS